MLKNPWTDLNPNYESGVEAFAKELFEYSQVNPILVNADINPHGFIRNVVVNATKPFIHIKHPELFADVYGIEKLRDKGKDIDETHRNVDQMLSQVIHKWPWPGRAFAFYTQYIAPFNPMYLLPQGEERIQITCRAYSLWCGSFLKTLRKYSDKYKTFKNLQVRYRDGVAAGLGLKPPESKENPRRGHHIWIEYTLDNEDWKTFDGIFPHDPGHPPEYYLTMDQVYKEFELELDENNIFPGRHLSPLQTYNQFTVRDILSLLNELIPTHHFVEWLSYDGIKIEQKRMSEMKKEDISHFWSHQLEKEKKVFEALKRDVFPIIANPDIEKLREIRKHIDYKLKSS